ncbi:hypothetical protein KO525_00735 [Psychrosphaera sp. B3R10]|uniref:type VI secretion protein IcmF/TssM N-terminal domain-containing protein n=1 Tax=unclassified Psychrosphaera TaxID=2641570 RepID=UPI001C097F96|nr:MULTISPECIES: type VI secretion protein IcmF/TssM N-terminal domain-containing protein [unclassified Psychrosphaera]MBU2880495.1 hypothetical protein [Psychrosphaera sp. I2R16]MBU2987912.1 hypothetical protein [Psychrosphaera sp. B3R10]
MKILLYIFIWLVISGLVIGGAVLAGEELMTGVNYAIGVFVAWLLFLLIRKGILYYRAKQQVEGLVNVEEGEKKSAFSFNFSFEKTPLEKNFSQMTKLLRQSYLKVHGDPMYVLPWYLVIGQNGSGKSFLLNEANLSSPTIDLQGLDKTEQDINWKLFNQGIALDVPSSYINSTDDNKNNPKWHLLLELLRKQRPKEPINGVVVTLTMEDLLGEKSQQLIEKAIESRRAIEQLMQQLSVVVPVYVVITHTDKMPGFNDWVETLPGAKLNQPIGEVNNDGLTAANFVGHTVGELAERIKQLMLNAIKDSTVTPELLLLPSQFEKLERHLSIFCGSLFQNNPYQKTPNFRSLYFTAADDNTRMVSGRRGLFSQILLSKILPGERDMVSSIGRSERIVRSRIFGKSLAWNATLAAVLVALYFSYSTDSEILDTSVSKYAGSFEESVQLSANVRSLYDFRDMVSRLEEHSWTPWMGYSETPDFIVKLQGLFSERVNARIVEKTDQFFVRELSKRFVQDSDISEEKIVAFISTLVRRINIIDAYLEGSDMESLPPPYSVSDADFFGIQDPNIVAQLNTLYLQSLNWSTNRADIEQEAKLMDEQLNDILLKSKDLAKWLIPWANKVASTAEIKVSDYWNVGTGAMTFDSVVNGAYTVEGKETIDQFIAQIRQTERYDDILDDILPGFEQEYKKQYLENWERFSKNFSKGTEKLNSRNEWLMVVNNLSTGRNLYFNALNLVNEQIAPYKDDVELPEWATMVFYYEDMSAFAPEQKTDGAQNKMLTKMALKIVGKAGPLGKALSKAGKKGMKTQKKMAKGASGPSPDERQMQLEEAGKLLGEYRESLGSFVYSAEMRSVSHAAISSLFSSPDNPAVGDGSLASVYSSLKKLQAIVGKETPSNSAFWALYGGAIELMQDYMLNESSCKVQDVWEQEFLTNIDGVPNYKVPNMVFGEQGMLWSFLDLQLAPFVAKRLGAGFVAKDVDKVKYPLNPSFLEFAAKADDARKSKQEFYPVNLATLPTGTNLDAKYHVSKTELELLCAEGSTILVNQNFANSQMFKWGESCSEVKLRINIGRFVLEKRYEGELGFPNFLADFKTGQKRFTAGDFPELADRLREAGVSYVDLQYTMSGQNALLEALDRKQLEIPRTISSCWNTGVLTAAVLTEHE